MSEYAAFPSLPRFLVRVLAPLLLLGLLAGCATPVGVTKVSSKTSFRDSTANPLNPPPPAALLAAPPATEAPAAAVGK
jgi:hypothetical protein